MSDAFKNLIPGARGFLARLAANNTRDWFHAHKADYDSELKIPAKLFLEQVRAKILTETGIKTTAKIFRINRDLRFSKDKTPYNTHLHMQWVASEGAPLVWMFGVSQHYVAAGLGVMMFSKTGLIKWRKSVAEDAHMARVLADLSHAGCRFDAPALKRVPAPYEQDHMHGELLRRKGLVVWWDLPESDHANLSTSLMAAYRLLDPVRHQLSGILR